MVRANQDVSSIEPAGLANNIDLVDPVEINLETLHLSAPTKFDVDEINTENDEVDVGDTSWQNNQICPFYENCPGYESPHYNPFVIQTYLTPICVIVALFALFALSYQA